jgi:hypothetical protein
LLLKNKTNQIFLPFICCQLGRSRNEKKKEKAREKERKVMEKYKKTQEKEKKSERIIL